MACAGRPAGEVALSRREAIGSSEGHVARRRSRIGGYGPARFAIAMSVLAIGLDKRKPFHAQ